MRISIHLFLLCLCFVSPCLYGQSDDEDEADLEASLREKVPEATDASSEKILHAHIKALGGMERILAITNTVSKGRLREGRNEYDVLYYRAAPDKLRVETTESKLGRKFTETQGYNGEKAWRMDDRTKNRFPTEMSQEAATGFIQEANFYGPLVNWQSGDNRFTYEGEVNSRGRKHHLLKMVNPEGRATFIYFDASTLMVTRVGQQRILKKSIVEQDTYYTKYERIDGVWYPTRLEFAISGQTFGNLEFSSIATNQPLEAGLFDEPLVKEVWLRKH